jgi:Tfp pilus assembly protein PilF
LRNHELTAQKGFRKFFRIHSAPIRANLAEPAQSTLPLVDECKRYREMEKAAMPTSSRKKRQDRTRPIPASAQSKRRTGDRIVFSVVCITLVLATVAVYAQSVSFDFITVDDSLYVTHNDHVKAGFTGESIYWAFTGTGAGNWHPLTWMSLMMDHQISGLDPFSYHLTNIVLHVLNALLILLVLRRLTASLWRSAFVAALFALHPLHVESVAWISERKDVLSTLCWLLGIWAYLSYVRKPSAARYAAVAGLFVLGIMAKPMLVTFPVTLLLLDFWPLQRLSHGTDRFATVSRLVLEKTPLFAITIASCIVTLWAQRTGDAIADPGLLPIGLRLTNAAVSYMLYLARLAWPFHLAMFYPHPKDTLEMWEVVASLIALAGMTGYAIRAAGKRPWLAFGWLWYLITLVPVIGIVQVGGQALADRYTYVPLLGIFVIISWGVPDLMGRVFGGTEEDRLRPAALLGAAACVILIVLAAISYRQVQFWQDDVTVWAHAVAEAQANAFAEYNLARALDTKHLDHEAIVHYREAVRLDPNRSEAYNNLGILLMNAGNLGEAESALRSALRANPNYAKALSNLGLLLCKMKRYDEGFRSFEAAVRADPADGETRSKFASSRCDYGIDLAGQGDVAAAVEQFEAALEIDPHSAMAHHDLGVTYAGQKKLDLAQREYEQAISADPNCVQAHNNLGILLGQQGKFDDAIMHFKAALSIQPDFKMAEDNLRIFSEARDRSRSKEGR